MDPFAVSFDIQTGISPERAPVRRMLSAMRGMYADGNALSAMLARGDRLVYEFYDMGLPPESSEVAFGTTVLYPGKVGAEYFMTKGHYHAVMVTAEVYYCLRGHGYLLLENPEEDWRTQEMRQGTAVYVPARYAHRSVNVSPAEPLVCFFAFRGDAGHDYGTIEVTGFRKLVVERDGAPAIVDNPRALLNKSCNRARPGGSPWRG